MRFSVTKYSFRRRSSWSTEPVIYASNRFQFIGRKSTSAQARGQPFADPANSCGLTNFEFFDHTRSSGTPVGEGSSQTQEHGWIDVGLHDQQSEFRPVCPPL